MPPSGDFKRFLETGTTADLGPATRPEALPEAELAKKLDKEFKESSLSPVRQNLVQALLLLWHDHLESAHGIAQTIETPDGAYIHGIMHRREPDYGNAQYWFQRLGTHPAFHGLSKRLTDDSRLDPALKRKLVRRDQWDPYGFIAACERVAGRPADDPEVVALRHVQQLEFENLLEYLCR